MAKHKIMKGDRVRVIRGNYRDMEGTVLEVMRDKDRVRVEGVNMRKKAQRPSQQHPNGGIIEFEAPVHYSNVMLVDKNGDATRVRYERSESNGKKTVKRIARTTNEEL